MGQGSGLSNSAPQIVDEEALALIGKSKGKEKKKKGGKKNLDMSKFKCFIFHKQGHFASQCPDKKKKRSFLIGRDYGMTLCRRRLARVKDQAHPALPHRLWMRRLEEEGW